MARASISTATSALNKSVNRAMQQAEEMQTYRATHTSEGPMNCSELIQESKKSLLAFRARLTTLIPSIDTMHTQLYETKERGIQEFTVLGEEVPLSLKLKIKGRTPPASIRFIPQGDP